MSTGPLRKTPPDDEIARLWLAADSLQAVAVQLGVTRELVRQCRNRALPGWLISLHKQRISARTRQRHWIETGVPHQLVDCRICGRSFDIAATDTRKRNSCGPACYRVYVLLRSHLPENLERHRHYTARWALANSPNPVQRRSAQRVLDGTAGSHGRWLVPGSEAHQAAIAAHESGWPVFDLLPEQIRQQVISPPEPRPRRGPRPHCPTCGRVLRKAPEPEGRWATLAERAGR